MPRPIKILAKRPALQPEELLQQSERMREWLLANLRTVVAVAGVILLAGAAWGIVAWFEHRAERRAAELYDAAMNTYQDALAPERQFRALSPETKEMFERAAGEFQKVRDEYPRTTHAAIALFHQANAYATIGRFDDAITAYQTWLTAYRQPDLRPLVLQRLAYVYWAKGMGPEAVARFEEITKTSGASNRDMAFFEMGRLFEQLGEKDKALEAYSTLAREFPASPWASEGNARIVALGGTPPAPAATTSEARQSEPRQTPPTATPSAPSPP